jgi:hypothetical protein
VHNSTVASRKRLFTLEQGYAAQIRETGTMAWLPLPAPRTYVECPRCHSPTAFITYERVETYCSFCPGCRHIWNTLQPEYAAEPHAAKSGGTHRQA